MSVDKICYPIKDRKGHVYYSKQEMTDAIAWLENDANYLHEQVAKYNDQFVKERVHRNALKSADYAEHLKAISGL